MAGFAREIALSAPQRLLRDYKPADFGGKRNVRRAPWFAAGVGIPLISVGLMTPKSDTPDVQAPAAAPIAGETALQGIDALSSTTAPQKSLISESAEPAAELILIGSDLTMVVKRGDSLDRLFKRNNLSRADLAEIMELDLARKYLRLVKPGDEIQVRHDEENILSLSKDISISEAFRIQRVESDFKGEIIARQLEARKTHATGTISSSLFEAAAEAGISDRTIMSLAGIFAWDVDFVLDIRQEDEFTLIYEELWRDGERLADGDILAAEFINQGERFRAIRYEDPTGRIDYYTPDGKSVRKAFIRAPLSFSRVSSNFNPRRRHPKLNTIRAHRGVDYAAPTGTPVKAAGDGKVIKRGVNGGYGNTVILQHGGNITTLYAHLSRFSKVRYGSRVRQGDIIGYVGATGLATGPHLHYEYRRSGVHLNPRTVKLPEAEPIDSGYVQDFQATSEPLLEQLDNRRNLFASGTSRPTS